MYCPSCGQQQISQELRYCSKCGMPLGHVAEVLANGGILPQLADVGKRPRFFTKKTGVTFGVFWFIILTMFLTAFLGILGAPEELIGIVAITGVFGGLLSIIGSLILLPSSKKSTYVHPPDLMPAPLLDRSAAQPALNPSPARSAPVYGPPTAGSWRDTNDLTPTETGDSATRLLSETERH